MNKFATLAALGGLAALGACATSATTTPVASSSPGVWLDAGANYTLTIKSDTKQTFFGQSQSAKGTVVMGLEVLRGGMDQRWRWTLADVTLDEVDLGDEIPIKDLPLGDISKILAPVLRLALVPGFECKVDASGACAELTNWSTWRGGVEDTVLAAESIAKLVMLMDPVRPSMIGDQSAARPAPPTLSIDSQNAQRYIDFGVNVILSLLDGFDTKTAGAATMAGPWGPFMLQGANLSRTGAMDYTMEQPLPYDGGALRYVGTRTVESIDRANGVATVVTTVKLDDQALFASLMKIFDAIVTPNLAAFAKLDSENGPMAQMVGAMIRTQFEAALKGASLDFQVTTRGTVDLQTGLSRESRTEYTGSFKAGGDFDWVEGSFVGDYRISIADGAPNIERLKRREILPLLPSPQGESTAPSMEEEDPAMMAPPAPTPPKRSPRPRNPAPRK